MGRGKTSAAIRYMNQHNRERRFLFATPYLSEVERICTYCDFEEPSDDLGAKSIDLKIKMRQRRNISMTHALFYIMDAETVELAAENRYSLIVDESVDVVTRLPISAKDFNLIVQNLTEEGDNGRLIWKDPEYDGRFNDYKALADQGNLFRQDTALLNIMNPDIFSAFEEVIFLTYLFDGQAQKAYLDYFGIPYRIIGIEEDRHGFRFSDKPDSPPPIDLFKLIHIAKKPEMNFPFRDRYALSKNWYNKHGVDDPEIKLLRRYLNYFFRSMTNSEASNRMWTCFQQYKQTVVGKRGKYITSWLPLNIRATNEYRDVTAVAYLVNRFVDPNLSKFFAERDVAIDNDQFALSEMVQFIWRSAIRDGKPIDLYIPSERMRNLLIDWMKSVNTEGEHHDE